MTAFAAYVEAEIARRGAIHLTKVVGLFEACTPKPMLRTLRKSFESG